MEQRSQMMAKVARKFGSNSDPVLLKGGQGNTWRSGQIILKPTYDQSESKELADLAEKLLPSKDIRIPRPVRSLSGMWIEEGFVAWNFLDGTESEGRYEEKLQVCDAFNSIFSEIPKPAFIEDRSDPWTIADRVTWSELQRTYEDDFQKIIDAICSQLQPVTLPSQIIHGDIAGNIIFEDGLSPGVIDLTLYWRPADYAKALLVVDAITWEKADSSIYSYVQDLLQIQQLLLRAGLRRIIEIPEQVRSFGKDSEIALVKAQRYEATLKLLSLI